MKWFPVLAYHRIVDSIPAEDYCQVCMTRKHFERQMRHFARLGYRTLPLEVAGALMVSNRPIPPKHFAITFDDGFEDIYSNAIPILRDLSFTATIFVVSGLVGKINAWDEGKGCVAPLMGWSLIKELAQAGFTIGAHTVSHPDLSQLPRDLAWHEISASREAIERMLGIPIRTFAYPYGKWSEMTRELVRDAGFNLACNDIWRPEHEQYAMARVNPRYHLAPGLTVLRFQKPYFTLSSYAKRAVYPRVLPPDVLLWLLEKWAQVRGADRHYSGLGKAVEHETPPKIRSAYEGPTSET